MQIVNTAPVAASATPVSSPSPGDSGGDSSFAKLLSAHHQPAEHPPADKPHASKTDDASKEANAAPEGAKKAADADDKKDADASTAVDPALAEMLAALNRPAPEAAPSIASASASSQATAASGDAAAGIEALAGTDAATRGSAKALAGANHGRGDAAADRLKADDKSAAAAGLAPADAALNAQGLSGDTALALLAGDRERFEQRLDAAKSADLSGIGPLAGANAATPADKTLAAAAPLNVNMTVPATAPEFREALGVQVSVLARDGVQHAHLHLNPADMGPISVQIALQGTQAQVDFGADSSATRHIIESGLPELAAALRDAGFTLSGGGVSQHPRGQADGQASSEQQGNSRGVDSVAGTAAPRRVSTRLPLGAVDLYA